MNDHLAWWEKLPVFGLFSAQGAYVWRWYVGEFATIHWAVVALAGIAAVAAIDGAMVSTVMGMRQGRRSRASYAAIGFTAAFGAMVALDLYGAVSGISAWLHAGFALTIVSYLLHLAAPREDAALALRDAAVTQAQHAAQLAAHRAAQAESEANELRQELAQRGEEVVQVGERRFTGRELAAVLDMSEATLRRRLAQRVSAAD
jgi:hypothetical protein